MTPLACRSKTVSLVICFSLVLLGCARAAFGSGDGGCSPEWRLVHQGYEGCSNMAFLSPSNDTRVNLLLMLADLDPAKASPTPQGGESSRPDAPLFLWEQLVDRVGAAADRAMLRSNSAGAQDGSAPPTAASDSFSAAVQADRSLRPEERDALLLARKSDRAGDAAAGAMAAAERAATGPVAREYARYLEGAAAFWQADYDRADAIFRSLKVAQTEWVRETALYMVGRTLINRAQVGAFDEYGSFSPKWHADAGVIAEAEKALDTYLEQHARGVYAQSARGLKRRGYWLVQDTGRLEEEYGSLLQLAPEQRNSSNVELVQEIDNKIVTPPASFGAPRDAAAEGTLLRDAQSPLLLAMLDLQAMRAATTEGGGPAMPVVQNSELSLTALQQQRPRFASQMPLYEYLLAAHAFYVEGKPAEVLRLLPDAARQSSYSSIEFSRQVLRGLALEAVKDRNALGFWTQLLPGARAAFQRPLLQLAIAHHEERAEELGKVFSAGSPVQYPYLRQVLLANVADAALLRAQATDAGAPRRERAIALFTLLTKEATRGQPAEFLKDVALVPQKAPTEGYFQLDDIEDSYYLPDGPQERPAIPLGIFVHDRTDAHFPCPGLRTTEEQLAEDANNPSAQLCLADFVRLQDALSYLQTTKIPASDLGGTPSLFPGGPFVRMDTYRAVLSNARSSREDRAYALFRAVNCYAPSGNNDCGGSDVPKAQRKAWFTELKHDYADTRWAGALAYYW